MRTKDELLEILTGTRCPTCAGPKDRHTWTCAACQQPVQKTWEFRCTDWMCSAHLTAADAYLERVKVGH